MTQLYSLADLVEGGIEIRSLKDIAGESKHPKAYNKYFEIEKRLIDEGKAVNLESYILQEYQFNLRFPKDIGKELNFGGVTILHLMKNLGIPIRTIKEIRDIFEFSEEAIQKMSDAKKGRRNPFYNKTGKEHPCYGIKRTFTLEHKENMSRGHLHGVEKPSKEELKNYYITKGKTAKELSEDYDVNEMTISKWLKSYGIPIISSGKQRKKKVAKEKITKICSRNDLTFAEKAEELEISVMTLHRRQKEMGIKSTRKKREYGGEISI